MRQKIKKRNYNEDSWTKHCKPLSFVNHKYMHIYFRKYCWLYYYRYMTSLAINYFRNFCLFFYFMCNVMHFVNTITLTLNVHSSKISKTVTSLVKKRREWTWVVPWKSQKSLCRKYTLYEHTECILSILWNPDPWSILTFQAMSPLVGFPQVQDIKILTDTSTFTLN